MPISNESLPVQARPDDEELLRHIQGNIDQFAEIINRHRRHVTRIVRRRVPADRVDEVAHDVFVKAYVGLAQFSRSVAFEHWIAGIAVRTCYDFWRMRKREALPVSALTTEHQQWMDRVLAAESDNQFSEEARRREATEMLEWTLEQLSPENRAVLTLVHLDGYSVRSLVAFPQVLSVMDDQLPWMERLGDAFISQQQQVMDTVQSLRQKASVAGDLTSNDKIIVAQQGQSIVIEPTDPQVVYVPYYDPMVMYGPWWWSAYPPIYWGMWPGYFYGPGFGFGFGWGLGIGIGPGLFFDGFNWQHRYAIFARDGLWAHDPFHRRGVPYRDLALSRQFGRTSASALARSEFRGHESPSFGNHGGFGNRPDVRGSLSSRPSEPSAPMRGIPERSGGASGFSGHPTPAPHAFEGIGQGGATRAFSMRGHESSQGSFGSSPGFGSRSSGGFHGGGGGKGGGGHR